LQATAGAGGVDPAARRPAGVVDADCQDAGRRARADPLRPWGIAVAVLGQFTNVADRDAGEAGDALDADPGPAQRSEVLADGAGVDVWLPAAVGPFSGGGAAGGGVGGGAVGAAAAVLDVGRSGAVPVAGLWMTALPRQPRLEALGSASGLLQPRRCLAQECRRWWASASGALA
jgi:hypothetical protein